MSMSTTAGRVFSVLAMILFVTANSLSMRAQESLGKISGTVKDGDGAAIVGVEVALINSQGAILRTTITDAEGSFMLDGVAPGNSSVSVEVTVTAEAGQVSDTRDIDQQVNVINEREILERAPEVVAQVVDEEPGVNLQRTAPSLSAVFVRGLTGRNVAVYVDGIRYTTSAQRGGVGTFFSLIEPSALQTVEVL